MYGLIGRLALRVSMGYLRERFGRALKVLLALTVVGVLVGGYLASRTPPET